MRSPENRGVPGSSPGLAIDCCVGKLLSADRAGDGVAEQEDADFGLVALGERACQLQRVVWALAAVRLVVDDDEHVLGVIVACPEGGGIGAGSGLDCGESRGS